MKKIFTTSLMAAALIGSGAASATSLTAAQVDNFSLDFGSTTSQSLSFNGFDSSLGTLTSVHLELTINNETLSDAASVIPTGGNGSVSNAFTTGTINVTGSDGLSASNSLQTTSYTGPVSGFNDIFASASPVTLPQIVDSVINTGDLSGYIGGSNSVTLNLGGNTQQSGTCANPVFCGTSGHADGKISIAYDYTPATTNVPEPTTIALLGLGFAGMAFRRRQAM